MDPRSNCSLHKELYAHFRQLNHRECLKYFNWNNFSVLVLHHYLYQTDKNNVIILFPSKVLNHSETSSKV